MLDYSASVVLACAIFAITIVLALTKPRGVHEAIWTCLGALVMLATGRVHVDDLREVFVAGRSAFLFLVALLILATLVDRSGLFEWAALHAARRSKGDGRALFRNVFMLGAIVTALLSLDTTAVLLTPVVLVCVRRLSIPVAPYVIACAFVANAASLLLPISNLTNLLFVASFQLSFTHFVLRMVLAQLAVLAVTYGVLRWHFRNELSAFDPASASEDPDRVIPNRAYFRLTNVTLALATVAYFVAPYFHVDAYVVAFTATLVLLVAGVSVRRVDSKIVRDVSWAVLPFVVGLVIVVQGAVRAVHPERLVQLLQHAPGGELGRILFATGGTATLSNVVNNLPAALVARSALQSSATDPSVLYATLLGTNVGPNLVPFGSLASVLVLSTARARGATVSSGRFFIAGLWCTPIACVVGAFALWLTRSW